MNNGLHECVAPRNINENSFDYSTRAELILAILIREKKRKKRHCFYCFKFSYFSNVKMSHFKQNWENDLLLLHLEIKMSTKIASNDIFTCVYAFDLDRNENTSISWDLTLFIQQKSSPISISMVKFASVELLSLFDRKLCGTA